jgi:cytochrome c553
MNRALPSFVKFVSIAALAFASIAYASENKAQPAADAGKGSTLYTNGDASRGITACVACHGNAGNSSITQNPKLAGQHAAYLQKQLHDFMGPARNNAVMTAIAKALSDDDIRNLSAYLEQQKQQPGAAKNKNTVELGKKIYRAGIAEKNVRRLPWSERRRYSRTIRAYRRPASGLHCRPADELPHRCAGQQRADDGGRQAHVR